MSNIILNTTELPHLLTLLFAVIFCRILWSGRNLWLLPVLIIPWTNLHGGFFVGILFTMAYAEIGPGNDQHRQKPQVSPAP